MKQPSSATTVSRETVDRLNTYATLLARWNQTINLVSRNDVGQLWERHINDALQLLPLMPDALDDAVDLGSGAGFPGIVLAIASGCHFHLIESDQRKAAFLREASRVTNAPVSVHATRIDATSIKPVRLVTARALAPLVELLGLASPFMTSDALLLAPKGVHVEAELTAAREQWHMQVQRTASTTNAAATILQITGVSRLG